MVMFCAGDGPDALYSSSSDADKYLAQQSPEYMGGHAILCHDRCGFTLQLQGNAGRGRGEGTGAGVGGGTGARLIAALSAYGALVWCRMVVCYCEDMCTADAQAEVVLCCAVLCPPEPSLSTTSWSIP
jgi:hypothetical protein